MSTEDDGIGHASGWSVDEDPEGGFRWTAYAPAGTAQGREPTHEDAERAAAQAEQDLVRESGREPRTAPGQAVGDDPTSTDG
jgi:hypothetical protein